MEIFNILGQKVVTLVDKVEPAGYRRILWNGDNIASGIYIYKLTATSIDGSKKFNSIRKMVLIK